MNSELKSIIQELHNLFWSPLSRADYNTRTSVEGAKALVTTIEKKVLEKNESREAFKAAGLYSAGFLFDSEAISTGPVFFSGSGEYKVPYGWDADNEMFDDLLQAQFLMVRELQKEMPASDRDYYKFLASRPKRNIDAFHYCSIGETMFYLIAWRRQARKEISKVDSLGTEEWNGTWRFGGERISDYLGHARPTPGATRSLPESWEAARTAIFGRAIQADSIQWKDELTALRLSPDTERFDSKRFDALLLYLGHDPSEELYNSDKLTELIDRRLENETAPVSTRDIRNYPLPVPAFYLWNALNSSPVTYLVRPIWASRRYATKLILEDQGEELWTSVVGLALCGVRALEGLDTTWSGSTADPENIFDFLAQCGQPLVELNFYDVLHEQWWHSRKNVAMAAIMSRNMSHNLGSHSLANARFFEAVGVLSQQGSAPSDDERNHWLRFPHPTVCTNASGERIVKEDPKPWDPARRGEVWRARSRLGMLNSYLQARMDFIARALGETSSQPEPMFFINDLLKGFLSQSVLLNTLLSDNGYTAPDLEFEVEVEKLEEDSTRFRFIGKADDGEIRHVDFAEPDQTFEDVLVAVPGGMVGRHAFYAFMENFMRNSAKYGEYSKGHGGKEDRFKIHLVLEQVNDSNGVVICDANDRTCACYTLTVTDNISSDPNGEVAAKIQRHLFKEIIDSQGRPQTEGHGIQEMKVCAQFLAGGDKNPLVFRHDAKSAARSAGAVRNEKGNSLQCHVRNNLLAYKLLFQQPRLLGIVDYKNEPKEAISSAKKEPTVVFYKNVQTLAKNAAYFGLILLRDQATLDELLTEIASLHTALPYRLMIVVDEEANLGLTLQLNENDQSIRDRIRRWQNQKADEWWQNAKNDLEKIEPFLLPDRRVHAISHPKLFDGLIDATSEYLQKVILEVYDKWLDAYKGDELQRRLTQNGSGSKGKWHLGIGFDRSSESVLQKWNLSSNPNDIELGFESEQVTLDLFFKEADGHNHVTNELPVLQKSDLTNLSFKETLLALDNHGNMIGGVQSPDFFQPAGIPAYHKFSGSQQINLFQVLDSPPHDAFSRSFMLFSVAEAMLTRVVVVDERLADATVKWAGHIPVAFGDKAKEMQCARIVPIYSIHSEKWEGESIKPQTHYLSSTAKTALENVADDKNCVVSEGLYFSPCSRNRISDPVWTIAKEPLRIVSLIAGGFIPDFIVIHEGVADLLEHKGLWPSNPPQEELWPFNAHQELYAYCPAVVRTSGRGSVSRHLNPALPFLEFSELSDSTYQQMNKVALVKGLMSLRGAIEIGNTNVDRDH